MRYEYYLSHFDYNFFIKGDTDAALKILTDFDKRHPDYSAITLRTIALERRIIAKNEYEFNLPIMVLQGNTFMFLCLTNVTLIKMNPSLCRIFISWYKL